MNVVNKYLATLSLVVGILTAPLSVAAETYTRDNPNLVQCDTCYSVADFERKAKTQAQSNNADYHLVHNMNTEVVETVFTFHSNHSRWQFWWGDVNVLTKKWRP